MSSIFSLNHSSAIISLSIIEAHELLNNNLLFNIDTYCVLEIYDKRYKYLTNINKTGNINPRWNETFKFPLCDYDFGNARIKIEIMEVGILNDTCIAYLYLNLFDYLHKPDNDIWMNLSGNSKKCKYFGMLHLKMKSFDPGWQARRILLESIQKSDAELPMHIASPAYKINPEVINLAKHHDLALYVTDPRNPCNKINLYLTPRYELSSYECNICHEEGNALVYSDNKEYDVHPECIDSTSSEVRAFGKVKNIPLELKSIKHRHTLRLRLHIYDGCYFCNVCNKENIQSSSGVYHCNQCCYDAHPNCVNVIV